MDNATNKITPSVRPLSSALLDFEFDLNKYDLKASSTTPLEWMPKLINNEYQVYDLALGQNRFLYFKISADSKAGIFCREIFEKYYVNNGIRHEYYKDLQNLFEACKIEAIEFKEGLDAFYKYWNDYLTEKDKIETYFGLIPHFEALKEWYNLQVKEFNKNVERNKSDYLDEIEKELALNDWKNNLINEIKSYVTNYAKNETKKWSDISRIHARQLISFYNWLTNDNTTSQQSGNKSIMPVPKVNIDIDKYCSNYFKACTLHNQYLVNKECLKIYEQDIIRLSSQLEKDPADKELLNLRNRSAEQHDFCLDQQKQLYIEMIENRIDFHDPPDYLPTKLDQEKIIKLAKHHYNFDVLEIDTRIKKSSIGLSEIDILVAELDDIESNFEVINYQYYESGELLPNEDCIEAFIHDIRFISVAKFLSKRIAELSEPNKLADTKEEVIVTSVENETIVSNPKVLTFADIFLVDGWDKYINALKKTVPPLISDDNIFIGNRRGDIGVVCSWFSHLKTSGHIAQRFTRAELAQVLNNQIKDFNMGKDGKTFDNISNTYKKFEQQLMELTN